MHSMVQCMHAHYYFVVYLRVLCESLQNTTSVSSYMVAGKYCPLSTNFSSPHTCISHQEELAADMNPPVDAQLSQGDQLLQFSSQRTDKANAMALIELLLFT